MEKLSNMLGTKLFTQYQNLLLEVDKSCFTVNDPIIKSYRETTVTLLEEILSFNTNQLQVITDLINSLKFNFKSSKRTLPELVFNKRIKDPLLLKIIELSYTTDAEDLTPDYIACELSVCRKTIDRKSLHLELTCSKLINKVLMYKVKERLLKLQKPTTTELLRISGISTVKRFYKLFKQETGLLPFQYREKYLH